MSTTEVAPRVMPQSSEAEIAVLGAILINPTEALDRCLEMLSVEHFYQRSHRIIFETMGAMRHRGEPIDAITVTTRLKDAGKIDEVGGPYYISRLSVAFPTAAHIDFFIEILKEKCQLRQLIEAATAAIHSAYNSQDDVGKVIDKVETDIFAIGDGDLRKDAEPIKVIADRVVANMVQMQESGHKTEEVQWGFRDLDDKTLGLRKAEMVVVAARPGVGKTALALNVAEKLILEQGKAVAIFSLEMTADQLALRMACSKARVNLQRLYRGSVDEKSLQEFSRAAKALGNSKLFILDTPQISIDHLRASARRLENREKIQIVIVDYLQLMAESGNRNDSRERQVAILSAGLKALAKELNIPVLVLSQLNREMERGGRAPRLSDLRESGSIEQDADVVCLMNRQAAYDEETGRPEPAYPVDIVIAKNRNGPVGEIKLTFLAEYTRFEDFTAA